MRPAPSARLFLRKRTGGRGASLPGAGTCVREGEGGGREELGSAAAALPGPAPSFLGCIPRQAARVPWAGASPVKGPPLAGRAGELWTCPGCSPWPTWPPQRAFKHSSPAPPVHFEQNVVFTRSGMLLSLGTQGRKFC